MSVVLDISIPGRLLPRDVTPPSVCPLCEDGKIICVWHLKPLGHDGCDDSGMICPRCCCGNARGITRNHASAGVAREEADEETGR
jgi:hypothetical protein